MKAIVERRWNDLCQAVAEYGDHVETWNRAAALAEVQLDSSMELFLAAWQATKARREALDRS